jgi:hypothetical protein
MSCPNDSILARRKQLNPTFCSVATRTPILNWIEGKEQPRDMDAAFLGWAKKFTKGKPPA